MVTDVGTTAQIRNWTYTLSEWLQNSRKAECHRCLHQNEGENVALVLFATHGREKGAYLWCRACVINFFKRFREMEREARDAEKLFA